MAQRTARSLRYEYELYIEQEIENYKESIPRAAILAIGDEAAAKIAAEQQLALTELLLVEEVDRIIFKRLRLPKYDTWRRKRLKIHDEMRRPEHWGMTADHVLVRTINSATAERGAPGHVLVAGDAAERSALFLAANGCDVTAVEAEEEAIQRVMQAALEAGLGERLHAFNAELTQFAQFSPEIPLQAVICSHAALGSLSPRDRAEVIEVLKSATADGGVHLVETILAGAAALDELRSSYSGWSVSVEVGSDERFFLARKQGVSH